MFAVVGQFGGLVTLPRIADVYEALGRFLRDLNLLNEVSRRRKLLYWYLILKYVKLCFENTDSKTSIGKIAQTNMMQKSKYLLTFYNRWNKKNSNQQEG